MGADCLEERVEVSTEPRLKDVVEHGGSVRERERRTASRKGGWLLSHLADELGHTPRYQTVNRYDIVIQEDLRSILSGPFEDNLRSS